MNYKSIGEIGQNCVIGELSKYGIGVAVVLSDNYPFEFIAIAGNNLFKIQVKTSTENKNGHVHFRLTSNNWYSGKIKTYSKEDCDVIICYDLVENLCFLLTPNEFENKKHISFRYKKSKNNQIKKINLIDSFILSSKRIKEVFNFDVVDLKSVFSNHVRCYKLNCKECGKEFESSYKYSKYCGSLCKGISRRKVERPSKEQLISMISNTSILQIGKKYGVSDNAVRKWIKNYEI